MENKNGTRIGVLIIWEVSIMCNNFSFYIGTTYVLLIAVGPVVASSLHVDVGGACNKTTTSVTNFVQIDILHNVQNGTFILLTDGISILLFHILTLCIVPSALQK